MRELALRSPRKLDVNTAIAIIASARRGETRAEQARAGGVSRSTLQDWLLQGRAGNPAYEAFSQAVYKAARDKHNEWLAQLYFRFCRRKPLTSVPPPPRRRRNRSA